MKQIPQLTSPVWLGMRGPKTPTWDKTSQKHFFIKSHLDLQLRGGRSLRKDTAPFSINIWKRHRLSQLFLHRHFELHHHNKTGGRTKHYRMMNKQNFWVITATTKKENQLLSISIVCIWNCMFNSLRKSFMESGNFLFPHKGRNSTDQEKKIKQPRMYWVSAANQKP